MGITAADRRDYVENVTKLSLWLTKRYYRENESFTAFITRKTPLYRLTSFWDGENFPSAEKTGWQDEEWNALLTEFHAIYQQGNDDNSDEFERAGLEFFRPVIEPGIERDVQAWPWIPSCYGNDCIRSNLFGFFFYDISDEPDGGRQLNLHMANIYTPESPFANLRDRADELSQLLQDARSKEPQLRYLTSESWLNAYRKFQILFPDEWLANPFRSPYAYKYYWWGQCVNRRGSYHKSNGDYLRKTGKFLYPSLICRCSVKSVLDHLSVKTW